MESTPPFRHPHSEQRRPSRAHVVGPVLGPHARTDRTRDTRDAEPWLPAPEDWRPGEGQRLIPGAPHNGGKHPPRGRPSATPTASYAGPQGRTRCGTGAGSPRPHRPHPGHPGRGTLAARSRGQMAGGGTAPDTRRPSEWWKATPPGTFLRHPHSGQRRGARCGAGAESPRPHRPHPGHTGRGTLAARSRGRAAKGGTAPDTGRPSQRWKAPPPGDALLPLPQRATPAHKGARCKTGAGSPRLHRPHPGHTGRGTLAARSRGRAARGGTAPDTRRPSQWWKATPPGTFFRHPHSGQRRPARAHAVGTVLGPHARIDRTRDTRDAEPRLPAPEDGQPGEGQRLTPGAPHNGGRRPPGDALLPPPQRATPARKGARCGAGAGSPRPHRPRPGHAGRRTLAACSRGRAAGGGTAPDTRRPSQQWKAPPPGGRPSATPTASNAGPQGRTLWGRCWVHTPASTAPGTHGSRNPGYPLQRTGSRGRDSA